MKPAALVSPLTGAFGRLEAVHRADVDLAGAQILRKIELYDRQQPRDARVLEGAHDVAQLPFDVLFRSGSPVRAHDEPSFRSLSRGSPALLGFAIFLDFIRLEDVALLDVVELVEPGAALVALRDLLTSSLKRLREANLSSAMMMPSRTTRISALPGDLALEHVAARDGAHAGDLVDLADLGAAELDLAGLGRQHALDGCLDVVDGVVDNAVEPQLDARRARRSPWRRGRDGR